MPHIHKLHKQALKKSTLLLHEIATKQLKPFRKPRDRASRGSTRTETRRYQVLPDLDLHLRKLRGSHQEESKDSLDCVKRFNRYGTLDDDEFDNRGDMDASHPLRVARHRRRDQQKEKIMAYIITCNYHSLMVNCSDLKVIMSEINPVAFCFQETLTANSFVQ